MEARLPALSRLLALAYIISSTALLGATSDTGVSSEAETTSHAAAYGAPLSSCGSWPAQYSRLHREILGGAAAPRFTVLHPYMIAGLADNLACSASLFYFSLLTGRALLIDESAGDPMFGSAYAAPNVDWEASPAHLDSLTQHSIDNFTFSYRPDGSIAMHGEQIEVFRRGDLAGIGGDANVVHWHLCNGGAVVDLFSNPYHKAELFRMGLRPDTAYACALGFLFSPNRGVQDMFPAEAAIMADADALKIGIQIRTGDHSMAMQRQGVPSQEEAAAEVGLYQPWFECAAAVERRASPGRHQRVIWYVISDSEWLRKCAAVVFGSKVMSSMGSCPTIRHVRHAVGGGGAAAAMCAVGEHWLFSLADYHITHQGGFGRSAAVLSGKWDNMYSLLKACQPMSLREIADVPPGI